jgi:hypothetical protein
MAAAKTKEFEIYIETQADTSADNNALDLTDYVDVADNEAFEIHACDIVLDPTEDIPAATTQLKFQLADSNIQDFVSHSDRTSLFVARILMGVTDAVLSEQHSFSDITPLVVSKTLYLRNQASAGSFDCTLRIKGRVVKPSAKDYMALVLTQTGNVA